MRTDSVFPNRPQNPLYRPVVKRSVSYPIQAVKIDWDRLIAKRSTVLQTIDAMPTYPLKPEVLTILDTEKHPMYRFIIDLMWCTGARVSEILALTPNSFIDDGYDFGVTLKTLKQRPGRQPCSDHRSAMCLLSIPWFKIEYRAICTQEDLAKQKGFFRWHDKPLTDTSMPSSRK